MQIGFPSTKALRAFEAVARLGSVKAAAEYLCVTPSALSKRIQALEEELGQPLFVRDARGVTLTVTGVNYAERLQSIFKTLSEATRAARADTTPSLKIVAPPLMGFELIKKIKQFELLHPGAKLTFDVYSGAWGTDPGVDDADMVFVFGDGEMEGWETLLITPNGFSVPMCAPGYLPQDLDVPELANFTWIQVKHFHWVWDDWCAAAGYAGLKPKHSMEVNNGLMAKECAVSGMGIWMSGGNGQVQVREYYSGALVLAHPFHALRGKLGYYLAYHPQHGGNPLVPAFRDWFLTFSWIKPEPKAGVP